MPWPGAEEGLSSPGIPPRLFDWRPPGGGRGPKSPVGSGFRPNDGSGFTPPHSPQGSWAGNPPVQPPSFAVFPLPSPHGKCRGKLRGPFPGPGGNP